MEGSRESRRMSDAPRLKVHALLFKDQKQKLVKLDKHT
jgi:hypothetical protein